MARTITSLSPLNAEFKSSTFPAVGRTSDASGARPYLGFDATADEAAYFTFIAPQGLTTPISAVATYAMASATSGNVIFDVAVEAITSGDAMDTDSTESLDTVNTAAADAVPATAGNAKQVSVTLTNNDSIAAGDMVRVRFRRVGSSGSDTATGDANLYALEIRDSG